MYSPTIRTVHVQIDPHDRHSSGLAARAKRERDKQFRARCGVVTIAMLLCIAYVAIGSGSDVDLPFLRSAPKSHGFASYLLQRHLASAANERTEVEQTITDLTATVKQMEQHATSDITTTTVELPAVRTNPGAEPDVLVFPATPPSVPPSPVRTKALVILLGEGYRWGRQGTRIRDDPRAAPEQREAMRSHLEFFDSLKSKHNVEVEIVLGMYNTSFREEIVETYGKRFKLQRESEFPTKLVTAQHYFNHFMKDELYQPGGLDQYKFVLHLRFDLFLKPFLSEIFDPNWHSIMFPFMLWKGVQTGFKKKGPCPWPSDMFAFYPKKYFHLPEFFTYHDAWENYLNAGELTNDDFGVMLNTLHDSDSFKDWNPLYEVINRDRSTSWRNVGLAFDRHPPEWYHQANEEELKQQKRYGYAFQPKQPSRYTDDTTPAKNVPEVAKKT